MKKKVKIIRNILSILLSAALVFGEMSMPVYAAPDDEPGDLLVYDDSVDGLLLEEVKDMAIIEEAGDVDISALPDVPVYANYIYHVSVNPNDDPLFKNSDMAPKGQWFHESINSQGAWDKGADGTGVTVAVIDTGIDSSNNDIDSSQTLWAASFTNGEDENGHGTHCIGIVAARDNSIGGLGVAPNATIISVRAGDRKGALTNADIAQSINMAVNAGAETLTGHIILRYRRAIL